MLILAHVVIALASLIYTTYVFVSPSNGGLRIAYGLMASTIITGSYLIYVAPSHVLQTCVVGLVYLGVVSVGIYAAHSKLQAKIAQ